ncbi:MAG: S1-like domain-containing RNA-binding protein [Flavobacteriaceae bacterium]|nr:S1-like domain-containing RNA-binding protein [Flavobacteriaceae bacterium]
MQLGKTNLLKVTKLTDSGYLLEDEDSKNILLPNDATTDKLKIDDPVKVFVYKDSDDRLMATTQKPTIELEQFAYLQVKDINKTGVFMDWGISKDLMIPYAEQTVKMQVGEWYLVFMLLDEDTNRLIGSCKENEFVFFDEIDVKEGDKVDMLLYSKTDLGFNAIVNNLYKGLIFNSNIHKDIKNGDRIQGYVKQVREDGKIDLLLEPLGYKKSIDPTTETILNKLKENDGCIYLTDKSSPEDIKEQLGLSKKAFKRGLGSLYKQKKVMILEDCVKLISI